MGTSVEREKRAFIEFMLAQQWRGQQIKRDDEITLDQMFTYYRRHQDEFTTPARARWEELMVRFSKYPSEAAAGEAIARMGNQVLRGAPFAEVARAGSDGVEAADGGRRDWTAKGSLCPELDQALFSLPIGQLSPHHREPSRLSHHSRDRARGRGSRRRFSRPRSAIRDKIVKERSAKQLHDYLAKLQARTPVKTIFDDEPRGGRAAGSAALRRRVAQSLPSPFERGAEGEGHRRFGKCREQLGRF